MERRYEYQKPPENEDLIHKINLQIEGEKIGEASLEYRNQPFPFYYLEFIYIDQSQTGRGLGADLVEEVNSFLDRKGKPGILLNAIRETHPAHDLYAHHGWEPIPGHKKWFGYKLDEIPPEQIQKAIYAMTSREYRQSKPSAA